MEINEKVTVGANCRLCAQYQKLDTLFDLNIDKKKYEEITSTLSLFKATYIDLFKNSGLYLTICRDCYDFMIKINDFMCKVKNAQLTLSTLGSSKKVILPDNVCSTWKAVSNPLSDCKTTFTVKSEPEDLPYSNEAKNPFENIDSELELNSPIDFLKLEYPNDYNQKEITENSPTLSLQDEIAKLNLNQLKTKAANLLLFLYTEGKAPQLIKKIPLTTKNPKKFVTNIEFQSTTTSNTQTAVNKEAILENSETNDGSLSEESSEEEKEVVNPTERQCLTCNKIFKHKEALHRHRVKVHNLERRRKFRKRGAPTTIADLTCEHCNKVFTKIQNLHSHVSLKHRRVTHNLICDKCGKTFHDRGKFTCHLKIHEDSKPHVCRICDQTFQYDCKLRAHVLTHSEEKTLPCPHCDAKFKVRTSLRSHIERSHTNPRTYHCKYCTKNFRTKAGMQAHERSHTGDYFECPACDMKFTSWSNCDKHMKARHNITLAKKRFTPQGKLPIDPTTGEVIPREENPELDEWKRQILSAAPNRKGPKSKPKKTEPAERVGEDAKIN